MSKKILALAPHPDDIEFGCGATVAKYAEAGAEVWYMAFSPCNKSLPEGYEKDQMYEELSQSSAVLGVSTEHLVKHRFEVREFPRDRQEILEVLIRERKRIDPDLVLVPSSFDIHQDHRIIYEEGLRAFKHSSILGYELPWNTPKIHHHYFSRVSKAQLQKKIDSIACFKTQTGRNYADPEFIKGLAKLRGIQAGIEFAEGFEVIRWID